MGSSPRHGFWKNHALNPSRSLKAYAFLTPLLLAILGQLFLAQSQWPWTLWAGGFLVILCFRKIQEWPDQFVSQKPSPIDLKIELFLFSSICLVGLFFRLYRIDSLPSGLYSDQGLIGRFALRIIHEGWRPFHEIYTSQVPNLLFTYQLAGWFGLAGFSAFHFHLFFILFSLLSFPLIHWTFRQLSGPRVALISLFLLAVMRWQWVTARNGLSAEVCFYLFGALAFFLRGIRKQKPFSLALSVLFCGLGLYDYQSLKAVPLLLLVLAGFERSRATPEKKISRQIFFALVFLLILLAAPLLNEMASYHTFGKREGEAFILNRVFETKSLAPIPEIWGGTLLMFNRVGDSYPLANIPGHRMLDDLTGILFLLGLAMAWRVRRERKGFYPLASFFILSLPGLLSSDAAASNRLIGLTPFIAYFAGFAGDELFRATLAQARKIRTPLILVVVFCLLAITAQNTYTYFVLQATDLRCQQAFGLEPNYIGKTIVQLQSANPNRFHFFIGPFYFRNPTVEFLSYQARKDVFEFQLTDWAKGIEPLNKDAILFLEAGQTGVVNFLKTLFPMGREETYRDPEGHALLYLYFIPQESLTSATKWNKGLQGNYIHSGRWTEPAVMTRLDPVLNFSSLADFGFFTLPPYLIRWTGTLKIKGGNYEFQLLTPDSAKLWLDGKTVALEKPVALVPGSHTLRVDYEKDSGYYTALHLVWKKPGAENWEVVPATAFGHVSDLGLAVSR